MNLDLAGLVIMRLNHTSLESYFQKHLFDPLGIDDISFHPETNEKVRRNRVKMTVRQGIENPMENMPVDSGGTVEWTDENLFDLPVKEGDEFGGQGAIGSGISFMKVLLSLLRNRPLRTWRPRRWERHTMRQPGPRLQIYPSLRGRLVARRARSS